MFRMTNCNVYMCGADGSVPSVPGTPNVGLNSGAPGIKKKGPKKNMSMY